MPSTWIECTDVPASLREEELALARDNARSYLQCQIVTCLTSPDGLTLPTSAFRLPSKNEERTVLFLRRLWDLGFGLSRRSRARRSFDVWWLTGLRDETSDEVFPFPEPS